MHLTWGAAEEKLLASEDCWAGVLLGPGEGPQTSGSGAAEGEVGTGERRP